MRKNPSIDWLEEIEQNARKFFAKALLRVNF